MTPNNTQEGGPPMSNEHLVKVLDKLTDSFDDFKERLIRIEESVKTVNKVEQEVGLLALKLQAVEESTKSAHKRLDALEKEAVTKVEHAAHDERLKKLEKIVFWVSTLIIGAVILAVLGLVIVSKTSA